MVNINSVNNQKTIDQIVISSSGNNTERKTGDLGKDEFLNLLITQLKYQDPLKPVDDKEFIGQMAQFSALEQMQNLNTNFACMKAFSLIGRYVTANISDDASKEIKSIEGYASAVKISAGKTFIVVNGDEIPVDKITSVSER